MIGQQVSHSKWIYFFEERSKTEGNSLTQQLFSLKIQVEVQKCFADFYRESDSDIIWNVPCACFTEKQPQIHLYIKIQLFLWAQI